MSASQLAYEDYPPEFHQWLNDKFGDVVIGDGTYEASFVLYLVDHAAFLSYFDDYNNSAADEDLLSTPEYLKLRRKVCDHYPPLIAYSFNRALESVTHVERLLRLRDSWEAIIYSLHSLVIAEYRFKHLNFTNAKLTLAQLFNGTIKGRLDNIKKLLEGAQSRGVALHCCNLIPGAVIDELIDFNRNVRNEFSHVQALSEWQAKELIESLIPRIKTVLIDLNRLESLGTRRYVRTTDSHYRIEFEEFYGSSLQPQTRRVELDQNKLSSWGRELRTDNTLVVVNDWIWSLAPFIFINPYSKRHYPEIWFLKDKRNEIDLANLKACKLKYEVLGSSRQEVITADNFKRDFADLHRLCQ